MSSTLASPRAQEPNVVFILADNVGYGDLGQYRDGELRGTGATRSDGARRAAAHAISGRVRMHAVA